MEIHAIFFAWDSHSLRGTFFFIAMVPFCSGGNRKGEKKRMMAGLSWKSLPVFGLLLHNKQVGWKNRFGSHGALRGLSCHVPLKKKKRHPRKEQVEVEPHHCYRITQKGAMLKKKHTKKKRKNHHKALSHLGWISRKYPSFQIVKVAGNISMQCETFCSVTCGIGSKLPLFFIQYGEDHKPNSKGMFIPIAGIPTKGRMTIL